MSTRGGVGSEPTMNTEIFAAHRSRLLGIAYGMLGSTMEAEDVVQDAYLRWRDIDSSRIDSPAAYLTTVTTRLAIDVLRSARRRREEYVGPWLPEPLVTAFEADPAEAVAAAEKLSLGLMSALERLSPVERAVMLLREIFDMDYSEIADVVDKSPENCRQIAVRARQRAGDAKRRPARNAETERHVLDAYVAAIKEEDIEQLAAVFAADVVLWTDGGGKVRAARHSLSGAWRVARHLVGVAGQIPEDIEVQIVRCNGEPALLGLSDGVPNGLLVFEIDEGLVTGIRAQLNPDKLAAIKRGDETKNESSS
jgi:RNA polymerase sigma-70 factor, ECF subfamily